MLIPDEAKSSIDTETELCEWGRTRKLLAHWGISFKLFELLQY